MQKDSQTQHHGPAHDLDGLSEEEGRSRIKGGIYEDRASYCSPPCSCIITFCGIPGRHRHYKSPGGRTVERHLGGDAVVPQEATVSGRLPGAEHALHHFSSLSHLSARGPCPGSRSVLDSVFPTSPISSLPTLLHLLWEQGTSKSIHALLSAGSVEAPPYFPEALLDTTT